MAHAPSPFLCRPSSAIALAVLCLSGALLSGGMAAADDSDPSAPAAFLPGGMLGIQLGSAWEESKRNTALEDLNCQSSSHDPSDFDEVCFFKTSSTSLVAGAPIHDGFLVRKGDHVVLIGTGIAIKNADDPLAESVMQSFQSQVHATFQHTGNDVLFVKPPTRKLSAEELVTYSQKTPVLLVQLEPKGDELAVFYGYLAPVNAFGALTSD
jgi:hypothetical protein